MADVINPPVSEITLDPERQEQAKEYAHISRRLMLLDLLLGAGYVLLWLYSGWSQALKSFLLTFTSHEWLLVAGFGLIFGGIFFIINLPLSVYEGYILPHRYGISNQTLKSWSSDQIKNILLTILLGGFLLEVIYALLRTAPDTWWLWVGGILLIFNVLLANLAPLLLFPIFYKFVPLGNENPDLTNRLMALVNRAGTYVNGVFKFDMSRRTKAANAGLTGLGNTRRIILSDTLLEEFTTDEIETILAHELGHHVHKDISKGILIQSVITLGGLYLASIGLNSGISFFGFSGPADVAALPLFVLMMGVYALITMPMLNAYSRSRERQADIYALRITGNGPAFSSALTRLANQNLADADPEPWVEFFLYSHPALSKRIKLAEEYKSP
ncbi:M48 family metallopeptidase [Chloroflexota bacterium]